MRVYGVIALLSCAACVGYGQESSVVPRYLNGMPVKGEVSAVFPEGMEIRSGTSKRVYPWTAFSAGTRFRYDPLYRANLVAAQSGQPISAWTQPPDGGYEARTAPAPEALPDVPTAEPRTMALAELPTISARPRASLVGLDLRDPARALTWGFRYGPAEADTVYLVLDPAPNDGLPTHMSVWLQPGKPPERLKGSRRVDGEEATVSFRKQRFRTMREGVEIQFDLGVSMSTRDPGVLWVALDVELKQGKTTSAFSLIGAPPGVLAGDGNILARDLLSTPSLKLTIETVEGQPAMMGNVRMGRLRLIPRAGMDKAVLIQITDARKTKVLEESVPIQEGRPGHKTSFTLALDRLTAGQKYAIQARIDLGPFLGPLVYEESFVRP